MIAIEQLTKAELAVRDRNINEVRNFVANWINRTLHQSGTPKSQKLRTYEHKMTAPLVRALSLEMAPVLGNITRLFADREKYRNRPMIRLNVGAVDKGPDIWLLGWRDLENAPEKTEVHDHDYAEAEIFVYRGAVEETVWRFDPKEWVRMKDLPEGTLMHAPTTKRLLGIGTMTKIVTPYIHTIGAAKGHPLAITIHGYYTPLTRMNIFSVRDRMLAKTNIWIDGSRTHD